MYRANKVFSNVMHKRARSGYKYWLLHKRPWSGCSVLKKTFFYFFKWSTELGNLHSKIMHHAIPFKIGLNFL